MKIKKLLATGLACMMALGMMVGCSSSDSTSSTSTSTTTTTTTTTDTTSASTTEEAAEETTKEFASMKIAYATNAVDETFLAVKEALVNDIGPALNIEFIFSEAISDAGALTTFIENSYAAGADAVFTNVTSSIDQAAAVCEELGLYFVGISSADAEENQTLEHYVSVTGASADGYGEAYAQALGSVLADGEEHSILILSGAACYGATSFIEATAGSLRALQDVYGLTYTEDIDTLATTAVQIDCENDKGIKITIYPGMSDLATNVSPLLQTGDYDVLCGTSNVYDSLGVAVDEVETALGIDIKFISRCTFSDTIQSAFNSTDSQGSPVLDAIVLNGSYENISAVVMLRNAFDGYLDNMRDGDSCSRVPGMIPLVITSAEEYNQLASEDMPYCFTTVDEILALCGEDVTFEDIDAFGASLTTENILAKFAE